MSKKHLFDPTLNFLYSVFLKEQRALSPRDRVGFDAWLRSQGILNPTSYESIRRFEVASLDEAVAAEEESD